MTKNIVYFKAYNQNQLVKLISVDGTSGTANVWVPGNNALENFGLPEGYKATHVNIGNNDIHIPMPDVIVNCIADADIFAEKLRHLDVVIRNIKDQYPHVKIINAPSAVLSTRRNDIYEQLNDIDAIVIPKTVRMPFDIKNDVLNTLKKVFPDQTILVRRVATHTGISVIKMHTGEFGFSEKLDAVSFNGEAYYITAFVDFKSNDSCYRKMRIIMIDGVPYLRHQIVSHHWSIHSQTRDEVMAKNVGYRNEEEAFLEAGVAQFSDAIRAALLQIHQRLGLDVFGIDCALHEGKLLIFEINASMEFIAQDTSCYKYLDKHISAVKRAFHRMVVT